MEAQRQKIARAHSEFLDQKWEKCLQSVDSMASTGIDERKREANRAVVAFGQGLWRSSGEYRTCLNSLFPELSSDGRTESDRRLRTQLYNAAVLAFHSGAFATALALLRRVSAVSTARLHTAAQLLAIEIHLLLANADDALDHIGAAADTLRRIRKSLNPMPQWVSYLRLPERLHVYRLRALLQQKRLKEYAVTATVMEVKQEWKRLVVDAHAEQVRLVLGLGSAETALSRLDEAGRAYPEGWSLVNAGESGRVVLSNARGCVLGASGRPSLALRHFQLAARELGEASRRQSLFSSGGRLGVAFNAALALHLSGAEEEAAWTRAFDSLLALLPLFPRNPRLWLRLAEAALQPRRHAGRKDAAMALGVGEFRKSIRASATLTGAASPVPQLSLEFAALCLRNAHALLPSLSGTDPSDSGRLTGKTPGKPQLFDASPSPPMTANECLKLKCSIQCSSAFVGLCLGELALASSMGLALVASADATAAQSALGRRYAAEAAALRGDATAARALLLGGDCPGDLALAHTLAGDRDAAAETLKKSNVVADPLLRRFIERERLSSA